MYIDRDSGKHKLTEERKKNWYGWANTLVSFFSNFMFKDLNK